MNPHISRFRKAKGGFTLIEILVSITILGLMMVGVAQMMNSALSATVGGYKHLDADTQARMVLDRMAYDISKITKRSDVDYYFQKNSANEGSTPGNDQMAFYSESGGYIPTGMTTSTEGTQESNVSLVGYMINSNNQLVRLSKGLSWNGVGSTLPTLVFNPLANFSTNPYASTPITSNTITNIWPGVPAGTDSNYQVIGDQVFRLEYTFLTQMPPTGTTTSGSTATTPATATTSYFYDNPWARNDSTPNGLKDVTAIVVSIAVLDTKSRASLTSTQIQTAASYLEDDGFTGTPTIAIVNTSSVNQLPLYLWEQDLLNGDSGASQAGLGLPPAVASQVRFYQRYCYLNHLQ